MPEYRLGAEARHDWPVYLVWLVMLAVGLWAWPQLPARVATHFGLNGEANGWMSPAGAVFLPLGVSVLMWLFLPTNRNVRSAKTLPAQSSPG